MLGDVINRDRLTTFKPMPAPTAGIFDAPNVCPPVNVEWASFIIERLEVLSEARAWRGTEAEQLAATDQIRELLSALASSDLCESAPCEECVFYTADDPAIEYQPNDPFLTPDLIPTGYDYPPFHLSSEGYANVGLTALPIDFLAIILGLDFAGFPRAKFNFSGAGIVRLYLEKKPLGGLAIVTLDGNPVSTEIVDLSSLDLLALNDFVSIIELISDNTIEGGLYALDIIEVNVEDGGNHHIDVTFLPKISSENILGFGGGLRKIEVCGAAIEAHSAPYVPLLRQATDCVEWFNPATQGWECALTIQKTVCPDCGEELEESEGDEMACSKCQEGAVNFCEGRLQYRKADGTYADVPVTGLPTPGMSDPTPNLPASANHACWKAIGISEAFVLTVEALLEVLTGSGQISAQDYARFQKDYPNVNADNSKLFLFFRTNSSFWEQAQIDEWWANKVELTAQLVCYIADFASKERELSDADITQARAIVFTGISAELQAMLTDALGLMETQMFKQWAHNQVILGVGVCNCTQSGTPPPPLDDTDWVYAFDWEASGSLLGWEPYQASGSDPTTAPTAGVDGLTGNVTSQSNSARRSVNITHDLPLADNTTVIKQVTATVTSVASTNSNNIPEALLRLRVHAEPGAQGTILGAISQDSFENGTHVFTWYDLNWTGLDSQSSLLFGFQIGFRNPEDSVPPDGVIKTRRYEIRGEGTNPFV